MKSVLNGVMYDTDTAKVLASWSSGYYSGDFKFCEETLYQTKKGNFFLHGEGGPLSKYVRHNGNGAGYGEQMEALSPDQAKEWLAEKQEVEVLERVFGPIEPA